MESQKLRFKEAFRLIPDAELERDPEGVSARLVNEFSIDVPVLDLEHKHAVPKQVQVDVSQDRRRMFYDRSQPHYVSGTEVQVVIPFRGDKGVFGVRPTSFSTTFPFADVHEREIVLSYTLTEVDAGFDLDASVGRTIQQIQQNLDNLKPSAQQLKEDLQRTAASLIEQRRKSWGLHKQILAGLKMPVVKVPPPPPALEFRPTLGTPAVTRKPKAPKQDDSWDIFISHATEDKEEIARPLADALRARGLRVWYDEFALSLGDSLRKSIDYGIANLRFGVVILSPNFFEKHWPQQELNGLATREVRGGKVILPIWHRVGFADVAASSPTLADKLAVSSDKGLDYVVEQILLAMK
jgi:TIR domain